MKGFFFFKKKFHRENPQLTFLECMSFGDGLAPLKASTTAGSSFPGDLPALASAEDPLCTPDLLCLGLALPVLEI